MMPTILPPPMTTAELTIVSAIAAMVSASGCPGIAATERRSLDAKNFHVLHVFPGNLRYSCSTVLMAADFSAAGCYLIRPVWKA